MPNRSRSAVGMPRKWAIGTVKKTTASGPLPLDEPLEVAPPARGHDPPDRLARDAVEGALVGRVLAAAEVAVALEPREPVAHGGVRLGLAIGRVRRDAPPRRLDRPAAVRRDDEVDACLVHPLPELPPRGRAAVAEVEVDRRRDGKDPGGLHGAIVRRTSVARPAEAGTPVERYRSTPAQPGGRPAELSTRPQ